MKKTIDRPNPSPSGSTPAAETSSFQDNVLSSLLAVGTLTVAITTVLLFLIGWCISRVYHPDLTTVVQDVVPLTIHIPGDFLPEPLERILYLTTMVCMPVLVFIVFGLINRFRADLTRNSRLAAVINYSGVVGFVGYLVWMLREKVTQLADPDALNTAYFQVTALGKYTIPALLLYTALAYLIWLYIRKTPNPLQQKMVAAISWCIVAIVLFEIAWYNAFHLPVVSWANSTEMNAVYYAATQIFVGKSLLVDFNAQYGLYGWLLNPWFHLVGLTTTTFATTMAILNVASFLALYLGIKKLVRHDLFSLIIFLSVIFWQYWRIRFPSDDTPLTSYYFQYWPLRLLFPCLTFYIVTSFIAAQPARQQLLLPVLSLVAATGILWNLDAGLVAFGACWVALTVYAFRPSASLQQAVRSVARHTVFMVGALLVMALFFMIATKVHAGHWPDFKGFTAYQGIFYISGFYMLPMTVFHFWNVVALVYIAAITYCVYAFRRSGDNAIPAIAFLSILGLGLFAYFQGRSYALTLNVVMYPAIIIAGFFCSRLLLRLSAGQLRMHEGLLFSIIPFLFLADGAVALISYTPAIHALAGSNHSDTDEKKEAALNARFELIKKNIPAHDTVIILSKDYESYYYELGHYYNPVNIPGSSEVFFKTELQALLDTISRCKYPVVYELGRSWTQFDSILAVASRCTYVKDELPDHSFVVLAPLKKPLANKLQADSHTLFIDNLRIFRKYLARPVKMNLPPSIGLEMIINLDGAHLVPNEFIVAATSKSRPFSGFFLRQAGSGLNQYQFTYGNGSAWCASQVFALNPAGDNDLKVEVKDAIITITNNGVPVCRSIGIGPVKSNDGEITVNSNFSGRVDEFRVFTP